MTIGSDQEGEQEKTRKRKVDRKKKTGRRKVDSPMRDQSENKK